LCVIQSKDAAESVRTAQLVCRRLRESLDVIACRKRGAGDVSGKRGPESVSTLVRPPAYHPYQYRVARFRSFPQKVSGNPFHSVRRF
jgi:hypothetical protein